MNNCRSCGAEIDWIRTKSGNAMPLDPGEIPVKPDPQGKVWAIRSDGELVRGNLVGDSSEEGYVLARVSHFATCPNAKDHRRSTP